MPFSTRREASQFDGEGNLYIADTLNNECAA
jgi:hypothetical protein